MSHDHANASSTTQTNGKGWQRKYRDGGFTNIYPGYLTSWQGGAEIADVGKIDFSKNIHSDDMTADKTKYGTTGNYRQRLGDSVICHIKQVL